MKKIIFAAAILFTTLLSSAQRQINKDSLQCTSVAAYRLFPIQNTETFIKLDTRNGLMWQVHFDDGFQGIVNPQRQNATGDEVNDRYTLYFTQKAYYFVLLDQTDGRTWQVRWSMDDKNRGMVQIK